MLILRKFEVAHEILQRIRHALWIFQTTALGLYIAAGSGSLRFLASVILVLIAVIFSDGHTGSAARLIAVAVAAAAAAVDVIRAVGNKLGEAWLVADAGLEAEARNVREGRLQREGFLVAWFGLAPLLRAAQLAGHRVGNDLIDSNTCYTWTNTHICNASKDVN